MEARLLLQKLFGDISSEVSRLSDSDIKKIQNGGYSLTMKVVRSRPQGNEKSKLSEEEKNVILERIQQCHTREDGKQLLLDSFKVKKELEQFAKFLDVSVLKQDKVDQIREKIVEATVGAKLRSQAIQGKL